MDTINYFHYINNEKGNYLNIHILEISPYNPNYEFKIGVAFDRIGKLERLSSICKRYNAICGINGSYFDKRTHLPLGYIINNRKFIYKSDVQRASFGIKSNGEVVFGYFLPKVRIKVIENNNVVKEFLIDGINTKRYKNKVVIYTRHYGERTLTNQWGVEVIVKQRDYDEVVDEIIIGGNSYIPEDGYVLSLSGDKIELVKWLYVNVKLISQVYVDKEWKGVKYLITGGPYLVKDGKIHLTADEEDFKGVIRKRQPRTCVGKTKDGKLLFFVVDGRQPNKSRGLTFGGLAHFLLRFNIVEAIGLDGGTSSEMWINGKVVNSLINKREYPISNAILLIPKFFTKFR